MKDYTREERTRLERLGSWFAVPKSFFKILSGDEAIFLAFLADQANYHKAEEKRGGWFFCTLKQVEDVIHMKKHTQQRVMLKLQGKKNWITKSGKIRVSRHIDETNCFISVERRGVPPKRWFKINWPVIFHKMDMVDASVSIGSDLTQLNYVGENDPKKGPL